MTDAVGYEEHAAIWSRPPSWLYLPSQGVLGNGVDISDMDLHAPSNIGGGGIGAAADADMRRTDNEAAQPAPTWTRDDPAGEEAGIVTHLEAGDARGQGRIRGRGAAPGKRGGAHSAVDAAQTLGGHGRGVAPIRGHSEVPGPRGNGAGTADTDDADAKNVARAWKAQRRLDAKNAHLAASLHAHAERVLKRDAAGDRPSAPSPAERLAALRRRIAGKTLGGGGGGFGAEEVVRNEKQQAIDTAGDATPETGGSSQGSQAMGTNEVLNIHHLRARGREFTVTTACADGSNPGEEALRRSAVGATVAEPRGQGNGDHARAAAASAVAWHTAADQLAPA